MERLKTGERGQPGVSRRRTLTGFQLPSIRPGSTTVFPEPEGPHNETSRRIRDKSRRRYVCTCIRDGKAKPHRFPERLRGTNPDRLHCRGYPWEAHRSLGGLRDRGLPDSADPWATLRGSSMSASFCVACSPGARSLPLLRSCLLRRHAYWRLASRRNRPPCCGS